MKMPWEIYPEIWKTQSAFMSFIRGGIRRGLWEKNPIKLNFIKKMRKRVPLGKKTEKNPDGLVWGVECSSCGDLMKQSPGKDKHAKKWQVDHKKGNHSLKSADDIRAFTEAMIFISEDDLAIVCKECHAIKTYAERVGVSFEEAQIQKQVIQVMKTPTEIQKEFLLGEGYGPESIANTESRRECFVELLQEGKMIKITEEGELICIS